MIRDKMISNSLPSIYQITFK